MVDLKRLILVTGAPRSGTTTVGEVLGVAPHTSYVYEPMNFHAGDKCIGRYFEVPGSMEFPKERFGDLIQRIASCQLNLKSGVWPEDKGLRYLGKRIIGGRSRISYLKMKLAIGLQTIVWKDPIAALAAPEAALVHGMPVVVTYRTPYQIAASFKRMKWAFDVIDIQRRALAAGLWAEGDYSNFDLIDPVTNAAIMWVLVYENMRRLARQTDSLHIVHVDQLIDHPLETYRDIFSKLGLVMSLRVTKTISKQYPSNHSAAITVPTGHAHTKNRNLMAMKTYWQKFLTPLEIEIIKCITSNFQEVFETEMFV